MNAYSQALTAYSSHYSVQSPRSLEVVAFNQANARLRAATSFPQIAEALHRNRELWSIIATDVASEGNKLPPDVKARLFYLAEFTQSHSRKVLKDEAKVAPLIEINEAMISGLSGVGVDE